MSRYTTELRFIIQNTSIEEVQSWFEDYELSDYLTEQEISVIEERGTWSKEKLAALIVDHYYMHEIGLETVELFKHQVKVAMREIMEEKLPLIYSASLAYDPLVNVDFTETYTGNTTENTTGSQDGNADGLNVNSDTPQGQISKAAILAGNYASSTGASEGTSHSEDERKTNGTNSYTRTQRGNSGSLTTAQALVRDYRKNIIMINKDIINDLSSLFMRIY